MSARVATRSAALLGPAAAALLQQVHDDPAAPLSAAVCGGGGYGKTTLLRELAATYQAAGVPVAIPWEPAGDATGPAVLLVDDAHLLDSHRLREVAGRAEQPGARVVVAYRPWPRPAHLAALVEVLRRRHRAPLSLPPLTEPQVREHCAQVWGTELPAAWADFLLAQSAGVPRYLDRLLGAWAGADAVAGNPPEQAPAAALAPFAADLAELEPQLLTVLLAVEAGAGLSPELIAALLECEPEAAAELVAAAKATGMLAGNGTLVPLAGRALAAHGPVALRTDIRQRLAGWQLARGGPVLALMRPLLQSMPDTGAEPAMGLMPGAGGTGTGDAFQAAGDEAMRDDPALAARFYAAAAQAGRPAAARRALATALSGNLDLAALLADQVLAGGPAEQRPEAACVAAAALAHRNHLARSVELYRWATPRLAAGFGAVGLVGTGHLEAAERLLTTVPHEPDDPAAGPPTLLSTAAHEMARGVCDSVAGSPAAALSALVQAAQLVEPSGSAVLLPDSPAALAALVAIQNAEFGTAEAVLERALRTGLGGPLFIRRHRLLLAWTLMAQGRLTAAAEEAARAGVVPSTPEAGAEAPVRGAAPGRGGRPGAAASAPAGGAGIAGRPGSPVESGDDGAVPDGESGTAGRPGAAAFTPDGGAGVAVRPGDAGGAGVAPALGGVGGAGVAPALGGAGGAGVAPVPEAGSAGGVTDLPPLQGRDLIFAAALRIGLARRGSDLAGLRAAWPPAGQALISLPVDLFTLLPLGEITIAAARLGEQRHVQPALLAAEGLLARLGDPALWGAPLHWARLHAAILVDDRPAGEKHQDALGAYQDRSPYAAALSAAGRCWLDLLTERIDPAEVEAAACAMADIGLAWDGARLAGQAAIRTPDRKAMTALLDCARSLQARQAPTGGPSTPARRAVVEDGSTRPLLSEREHDVATLVLAGLTYKQVAGRLYLSAKTVEHHMARIRQRLGCTDRRELLARLRELTAGRDGGQQ